MGKSNVPWYKRVDNFIMHFENIIIGSGIIFISFIVILNTLMRYGLNQSLTWAEELARYVVVWICFVGCASCARYGSHVMVDVLVSSFKGKTRKAYEIFIGCACTGFAVFLANMGWQGLLSSWKLGNISVLTGIPTWCVFLGVFLGLALVSYNYAKNTVIQILTFNKPEESAPQENTPTIQEPADKGVQI